MKVFACKPTVICLVDRSCRMRIGRFGPPNKALSVKKQDLRANA